METVRSNEAVAVSSPGSGDGDILIEFSRLQALNENKPVFSSRLNSGHNKRNITER
jgi:hypothetical protein